MPSLRCSLEAITLALAIGCHSPPPLSLDAGPVSDGGVDGGVDGGPAGGDASAPPPAETVTIAPLAADPCASRPADYGLFGPVVRYRRYELENAAWVGGEPIRVYAPESEAPARPVVFYSHAFGGNDPSRMLRFIEMLVSQDVIVVFSPYPTAGASICGRYDVLQAGFDDAVALLGEPLGMDLTRVGFVGHSFGGGATPRMAYHGIIERGFGAAGSFAFASAPYFAHRMDPDAWSALSAATRFAVMTYQDDTINDHRIAIEEHYAQFSGTKAYLELASSTHGECVLDADHNVPPTVDGVDALDAWGFWRHVHALLECTLRDDGAACGIADGTDPAASSMGSWADGTPLPPVERPSAPEAPRPSDTYRFPIDERIACDAEAM